MEELDAAAKWFAALGPQQGSGRHELPGSPRSIGASEAREPGATALVALAQGLGRSRRRSTHRGIGMLLTLAPVLQAPVSMKRQIEMSAVEECAAIQCAYNQEKRCFAKAITVGGSTHPACDTYVSDDTLEIPSHVVASRGSAGVGACKTAICIHNQNLECAAPSIRVEIHADHADCSTYSA